MTILMAILEECVSQSQSSSELTSQSSSELTSQSSSELTSQSSSELTSQSSSELTSQSSSELTSSVSPPASETYTITLSVTTDEFILSAEMKEATQNIMRQHPKNVQLKFNGVENSLSLFTPAVRNAAKAAVTVGVSTMLSCLGYHSIGVILWAIGHAVWTFHPSGDIKVDVGPESDNAKLFADVLNADTPKIMKLIESVELAYNLTRPPTSVPQKTTLQTLVDNVNEMNAPKHL